MGVGVSTFELLGSQTAKWNDRPVKDENVVSFDCGRAVLVVTGCGSLRRSSQSWFKSEIAVVPGGPMYGKRDSRNTRTVDELIVAMARIGLSVATDYGFRRTKNK
jgi:hypothetical protein